MKFSRKTMSISTPVLIFFLMILLTIVGSKASSEEGQTFKMDPVSVDQDINEGNVLPSLELAWQSGVSAEAQCRNIHYWSKVIGQFNIDKESERVILDILEANEMEGSNELNCRYVLTYFKEGVRGQASYTALFSMDSGDMVSGSIDVRAVKSSE